MSTISALEFGKKLASGEVRHVVDVRTPAEFAGCHVAGAKLAPLDSLDPRTVADALKAGPDAEVFLLCKGGTRAGKAAEQFRAAGFANVCVIEGGTDACVAANVPVERSGRAGIPLDGQVRIAIGGMIVLFWLLARLHPGFGYLLPLMAAALIISGITGFCGMAILLGKAPWNQSRDAEGCRIC
jgi:rhodanese-related sulfurtransferase